MIRVEYSDKVKGETIFTPIAWEEDNEKSKLSKR